MFSIFERLWLVNGVSVRSGQTEQSAVGIDFGENFSRAAHFKPLIGVGSQH
jgi:hypothetical protein